MGASQPSRDGIISGINVTPLVDITLVLLIIFIVTARIIVTPAVPLDLPKASRSEQVQMIFAVMLPRDGPVRVNGTLAPTDDELLRRARAAFAQDHDLRAVISAEGSVPHRRVIHALDLLRTAGISRVAFGALPVEEPPR